MLSAALTEQVNSFETTWIVRQLEAIFVALQKRRQSNVLEIVTFDKEHWDFFVNKLYHLFVFAFVFNRAVLKVVNKLFKLLVWFVGFKIRVRLGF